MSSKSKFAGARADHTLPRVSGSGQHARRAAAERYRPAHVRLLLVAEAPPNAEDRYFYFPSVGSHDSLFRYISRLVLEVEPTRGNKEELLGALRDAGVFLIDVCLDPISDKRDLRLCVDDVLRRAAALEPDHVILIKATVFETLYWPMKNAGLPVIDIKVPFPGSGQQTRFEIAMRDALDSAGWHATTR